MEQPIKLAGAAGEYMESATLLEWLKASGDAVAQGDPIAVVETAKASTDVLAPATGVLTRVAYQVGDEIPVGAVIGWIETNVPAANTGTRAQAPTVGHAEATGDDDRLRGRPASTPAYVRASPIARRLARELNVDLHEVAGSGPRGRVSEADVKAAAKRHTAPSSDEEPVYKVLPMTNYRRRAAQRMQQSASIPQFQLTIQLEMTALLTTRESFPDDGRPSITGMMIKALVRPLREHPRLNARYIDEEVRHYHSINIGVATATDVGLAVPVIHAVDQLTLSAIDRQLRETRTRASRQELSLDDVRGATFTISNLGAAGILHFTALINPPQTAILAIGAVHHAWMSAESQPRMAPACLVTLSCDHRATDGMDGARFLQTLKATVEDPATWSAK